MYYIAYTIIAIGLGGVVFLLIKKIPQFFSKGEAEFDTLLQRKKKEKSRFKKLSFDWLKKKGQKISFGDYKDNLINFFKDTLGSINSGFKLAKRKIKDISKSSLTWVSGLKEKVNIQIKSEKEKSSKPQKLKEKKDQLPEAESSLENQEEFFSELLGERKGEEKAKTNSSRLESSKNSEPEKAPDKDEPSEKDKKDKKDEESSLSKEEKEIQQWIEKLKEEPKNGEAYMELGFIYFEQGQEERAKSCLEGAKKLGVENERVDDLLSRLKD